MMSGNATGPQFEGADHHSNMTAYDQLPRYMRECLANADQNYAAREILRDMRSGKLPRCRAVEAIRNADRAYHEDLVRQGWILGGQR